MQLEYGHWPAIFPAEAILPRAASLGTLLDFQGTEQLSRLVTKNSIRLVLKTQALSRSIKRSTVPGTKWDIVFGVRRNATSSVGLLPCPKTAIGSLHRRWETTKSPGT